MVNTYDHPKTTFAPTKILFPQTREEIDVEHVPEDVKPGLENGTLCIFEDYVYATMLGVWLGALGEN